LFEQMLSLLREMVVSRLSHLEIHMEAPAGMMRMPTQPVRKMFETRSDPALAEKEAQAPFAEQKLARNEPCPCGSGKKFKHCHGAAK
ncbi:MAG: SEC-C domain-containing protein, partial [Rickettsiales bacterium]|nr:SEC-C domain-containing protein [Rickettsiales bacterium]